MKYISIILLFAFIFLGSINRQPQKIQYVISEEIKKEIKKIVKELKLQHKREGIELSNEDFYVRIGLWHTRQLYIHIDTYTKKDIGWKNISRTNRYIQVNGKLQLPVVFDYDEHLSSSYKNKDGSFTMVTNHGGKWLFMDFHGNYLQEPK